MYTDLDLFPLKLKFKEEERTVDTNISLSSTLNEVAKKIKDSDPSIKYADLFIHHGIGKEQKQQYVNPEENDVKTLFEYGF